MLLRTTRFVRSSRSVIAPSVNCFVYRPRRLRLRVPPPRRRARAGGRGVKALATRDDDGLRLQPHVCGRRSGRDGTARRPRPGPLGRRRSGPFFERPVGCVAGDA